MTETDLRTVQVANTTTGRYDVHKPLPYPFHIEPDGAVARQDFWRGEPARLAGFQRDADENRVDVRVEDWLADPELDVTGTFPVFVDADGSIWRHAFPVREG